LRPTTVGYTARYVAKSKRLKEKKHQDRWWIYLCRLLSKL
jgi:hypothetical protein